MIITVASYKGGVGKTTTAVHLAGHLQSLAPTVLFDGDQTRNATLWSQKGNGFPFTVAPVAAATKIGRNFRHAVVDTGQRMSDQQLREAVMGCDLIVVPTVVSALDTDGLGQTIRALQQIPGASYRVLLTRVRPDALNDAAELRKLLAAMKAPVFRAQIPQLKAFEKAADLGVLVREVDDPRAARCWSAYLAAGKELKG